MYNFVDFGIQEVGFPFTGTTHKQEHTITLLRINLNLYLSRTRKLPNKIVQYNNAFVCHCYFNQITYISFNSIAIKCLCILITIPTHKKRKINAPVNRKCSPKKNEKELVEFISIDCVATF